MSLARVRALVVLGLLVLMAAVAAGWAIAKDSETVARHTSPCAGTTLPFSTTVPADPATVRVNVYNATSRAGLANTVADELRTRRFTVGKIGNDPLQQTVEDVAQIRYGPRGAGAAQLVRAWLPGSAPTLDKRADKTVDLVLGLRYEGFTTPADHELESKRLGAPTPPRGTC
jgi:hypothetical protein